MISKPIGIFHSTRKHLLEAPSQSYLDPSLASEFSPQFGEIEFFSEIQPLEALKSCGEIEYFWILFHFHLVKDWHPLVTPPRNSEEKKGIFATRSPHRPNPLGLSLVKVVKQEQNRWTVQGFDLIDQTPILDVKPWHPQADQPWTTAHRQGWLDQVNLNAWKIEETNLFKTQCEFLELHGVLQLRSTCHLQLKHDPWNEKRKRIEILDRIDEVLAMDPKNLGPDPQIQAVFSYRTWRIHLTGQDQTLKLLEIKSGYTKAQLQDPVDRWLDKKIHRLFGEEFQN